MLQCTTRCNLFFTFFMRHLVCQRCERLFEDAAVHHQIRPPDVRRHGFTIHAYSIYFAGLCASCKEARGAFPRSVRLSHRRARKGKTSDRTSPRS